MRTSKSYVHPSYLGRVLRPYERQSDTRRLTTVRHVARNRISGEARPKPDEACSLDNTTSQHTVRPRKHASSSPPVTQRPHTRTKTVTANNNQVTREEHIHTPRPTTRHTTTQNKKKEQHTRGSQPKPQPQPHHTPPPGETTPHTMGVECCWGFGVCLLEVCWGMCVVCWVDVCGCGWLKECYPVGVDRDC